MMSNIVQDFTHDHTKWSRMVKMDIGRSNIGTRGLDLVPDRAGYRTLGEPYMFTNEPVGS